MGTPSDTGTVHSKFSAYIYMHVRVWHDMCMYLYARDVCCICMQGICACICMQGICAVFVCKGYMHVFVWHDMCMHVCVWRVHIWAYRYMGIWFHSIRHYWSVNAGTLLGGFSCLCYEEGRCYKGFFLVLLQLKILRLLCQTQLCYGSILGYTWSIVQVCSFVKHAVM